MTALQTLLDKIVAEAAEKSRVAIANADLIEHAAQLVAQINAVAGRDIAFLTHHYHYTPMHITVQGYREDDKALLAALDSLGTPLDTWRRCDEQDAYLPLDRPGFECRLTAAILPLPRAEKCAA